MVDPLHIVGIDVGGTFIDYVAFDPDQPLRVYKALNRPATLAEAILEGLRAVAPDGVREVVHGTTVATNALIERRGARVALVTTKGFADIIEIGRQDRSEIYSLESSRPDALVGVSMRFEVDERVGAAGEILKEPTAEDLTCLIASVSEVQPEAVAVCLLFSFLHPAHEESIARELRAAGAAFVTTSAEVLPEYREYERVTTTVANAYVSPRLAAYLGDVSDSLRRFFGVERFEIMQSNGGLLSADEAARNGARMLLSGPAGGVAAAYDLARRHSINRIITFDMGGTSTDVALCDGSIPTTVERTLAGIPVRLPMVDIETVGAGGGSVARLDSGGALRVGPDSAGADPGPACFGKGTLPTVTDAQAVCGFLDVKSFLGGRLRISMSRAKRAISTIAGAIGTSEQQAAEGVLQVANVSIQQAIRRISVERGFDPRDFTLVAFGGAGPIHACGVAEGLGITRIMIPAFPGVMAALGITQADAVRDFSHSVVGRIDSIDAVWQALENRAKKALPESRISRALDCRYRGQGYELEIDAEPVNSLIDRFHTAHLRRYGFEDRNREVEIVTARVRAVRPRHIPPTAPAKMIPPEPPRRQRIRWAGRIRDTRVQARQLIAEDEVLEGPALLVQPDSAVFVAPNWRATQTSDGTLMMEALP